MRREATPVPMRTGEDARFAVAGQEVEFGVFTASEELAQDVVFSANFRELTDIAEGCAPNAYR